MVNRQKKSWMIFAITAFAVITLLPKNTDTEDTRGIRSEPLRISSRKDSPAYTAFVFSDWKFSNSEKLDLSANHKIKLTSGRKFNLDLLKDKAVTLPFAKVEPKSMQRLKGMVISSRTIAPVLRQPQVAGNSVEPQKDWIQELKATVPNRDEARRLAMIEDWLKGSNWSASTPSQSEVWKKQIRDDVAPTDRGETVIAAASGTQIYVGLPEAERKRQVENNLRERDLREEAKDAAPSNWKPTPAVSETNLRPLTLAGYLEMKDGLAFLGSETSIVVSRKIGDKQIEVGSVRVSEGTFEIFVKEAKGYLVAELKNKAGSVLGRGSVDLFRLPPAPGHQMRLDGIHLSLEPISKASQVATYSAHSFGGYKIADTQASVVAPAHDIKLKQAQNLHVTEDFVEGSTAFLEAQSQSKKDFTTIDVTQLSAKEEMYVFDEKYIGALVGIVAPTETDLINKKGFIMGRVSDQGKPLSGAVIEIAGDVAVEAIYFNDMYLPDKNLKATSANGMFAAVLVEPAIYSVRAKTNGVFLPAKVLPAVAGQITQALLERKEVKSLAVNIFPFPGESSDIKQVNLSVLGTEEDHVLPMGTHVIQYHEGRGVFVLESLSGDFDPLVRLELPHGATEASVPVISRFWLEGLATKKRVNLDPDTGRVFGFGPNESYEVMIDKGQGPENIVYMDEDGKPLYEGSGRAGGAFAIYNLKPGIHSISVMTRNGSKIFSRVIVAEVEVVNFVDIGQ